MSNPLINMMARQANGNMPGMQMLQQFQQFKSMWTPQAAQQKLTEMLQTGQINGQQLEQAKQMAQQMQRFLKRFTRRGALRGVRINQYGGNAHG